MKTLQYIKKVQDSQQFTDLLKKDPKMYLCSFFFIRDFIEKKDETQIDFYSPDQKNIVSFKFDPSGNVEKAENKTAETISHKEIIPEKLPKNINLEMEDIKPLLEKEMEKKQIKSELQKLLVYLVSINGKTVWNCTGFLKGLAILQAIVEDSTSKVLVADKKSFFDMIKFTGKPGKEKK